MNLQRSTSKRPNKHLVAAGHGCFCGTSDRGRSTCAKRYAAMDIAMTAWLRTDEHEEAVAALEAAAGFGANVSTDIFAWRWTILSLHNACQGLMVVALRDSAGLNVLPTALARAWLEAHESGEPYPEERLDSFLNLYRKLKKQAIAQAMGGTPFRPKGTQTQSMKRLNSFRNTFIHFLPASWSLEVTGLPSICLDVLGVIDHAAFRYRLLNWSDEGHQGRMTNTLERARSTFAALHDAYVREAA